MSLIKLKDFYFLAVAFLIWAVHLFPSGEVKIGLVNLVGSLAYHISRSKRLRGLGGLEQCFGCGLDEKAREEILRNGFRGFWRDTFSVLPSELERIQMRKAVVQGETILAQALRKGKGLILLESNSFGYRILAKRILCRRGWKLHQVHSSNHLHGLTNDGIQEDWVRRSLLSPLFEDWERGFVTEIIRVTESGSLSFARLLLQRLRENRIICSAGDGRVGQKMEVLPFLNQTRSFATGMFSLARLAGCPVVPIFCYWNEEERIQVVIGPIITIEAQEEREKSRNDSLSVFVQLLEGWARKYPSQYRGWHL